MASMEELDQLGSMAELQGFLPYLQDAIDKMERTLENKVFMLLDQGKLTEQLALYAWQEKLILRRIVSRFNTKIRVGSTIAERYSQDLNIGVE